MIRRRPRVLLLEAEIRTSGRTGRPWYSAWLGRCRLVGFEAEQPNARRHRVIRFYAEEADPRESTPAPRQCAPEREAANGCTNAAPPASARPGGSCRAPRPESARARQERVADEVAAEYGVHRDEELNDAVPF